METRNFNYEKYNGKFIATESFNSNKVIAHGSTIIKAYNRAQEKGFKDPVIDFVPKKGSVCIY